MTVQHALKVFDVEGFHSPAQRLVLLELAYRADKRGIVRRPQSEIAATCALSRTTVAQWFNHFEQVGLIERVGHGRYQVMDLSKLDEDPDEFLKPVAVVKRRPGADEELERLKAIRQPHQVICYTPDAWPVLRDKDAIPDCEEDF